MCGASSAANRAGRAAGVLSSAVLATIALSLFKDGLGHFSESADKHQRRADDEHPDSKRLPRVEYLEEQDRADDEESIAGDRDCQMPMPIFAHDCLKLHCHFFSCSDPEPQPVGDGGDGPYAGEPEQDEPR